MGTTISALLVVGDRGFIAHVGDSRVYLLRQSQVIQLTEDHSLINELIRRGKVTKENLARSPYSAYKNAVTRAVGVYETVQVDTIDFDVLPGDQFLICSDGLHTYLDDDRLRELFAGRRDHRHPEALHRPRQRGRRPGQHHGDRPADRQGRGRGRRYPRRGADAQDRGPQADAAVPAPDLQGDHPGPQPHRGLGLRPRRGRHEGGRAGRRPLHPAAGPPPAAQGGGLHHQPHAGGPPGGDGAHRSFAPIGHGHCGGALAPADPAPRRSFTRSSARTRPSRSSCSGASFRC